MPPADQLAPGAAAERGAAVVPAFQTLAAARDHAVLAAALDPIITIDAYGTIQSASDSVFRVFGWTPAELTGRNIHVLMPEPHHSAHDGYLAGYRRTGRTNILGRTREFEAVRKSGERFPIELSVARVDPPPPHDGSLPLFVGMIRDITERKRLERELRLVQDLALSISNAESLPRALEETLRLICLATEWDYGEVWMPVPTGEALAGAAAWMRPGSGLEGFNATMRQVRISRGDSLAGRVWESGQPAWIGDVSTASEAVLRRADVARRAGLRAAAGVPILAAGRPIAVLLFFVRQTRREDLHLMELVRAAVAPLGSLIQRKEAEDELDDHRRRLEEKVQERTQELQASQDRLRLADRLASIGTLAAGLGHDMNNVLLPVRAHLNALRTVCPTSRSRSAPALPAAGIRAHLEQIGKGVAYLQQLADGLHFLAMDPEGDADARSGETTDLRRWWAQTGVLIAKALPKHVRLSASFPTGLPEVAVAAHGLTQAVLNLVVNAGEAIPAPASGSAGRGRIRVWAKPDDDGDTVRLGVTDNGRGMPDEVKRRAFEMFFTTKTRGLGTGLGLALVNKVAVGAGGRVELQSEVGRGTTVVLILKAAARPAQDRAAVAVVSIADGRSAALIGQILQAGGAELGAPDAAAAADIRVLDPADADVRDAEAWRKAHPQGQLVLFGAPPIPAAARRWGALNPLIIERRDDFEALRSTLGRALAIKP